MVQFPKRDRWFPARGVPRGVLLLTHGLNLHPERMDDLAAAFSASGLEVFRPAFFGHHEENGDFLKVDPEHWEEDARSFHALVNARAEELRVPLFLGAYSFSALIFQVLREDLPFARRILWAPALKLHFWYPIAALVLEAFPDFSFSSRVPGGYSANARSGLRAFRSLHHFRKEWRRMREKIDGVPTLIWASPKDELVHGRRLREMCREPWEFREASVRGCRLPEAYEHLIIDRASVGEAEFQRMVSESERFLLG